MTQIIPSELTKYSEEILKEKLWFVYFHLCSIHHIFGYAL